MWQQLLYIWAITCVSATGTKNEQFSNLKDILKPRFDIFGMVIKGLSNNSTSNKSPYEEESLQFLWNKVVSRLHNPSTFICDSPYEAACGRYYNWGYYKRPSEHKLVFEPLKQQLFVLKIQIEKLLEAPVLETDAKSLIVEKQLYQDCLAIKKKTNILKSQSIIDYVLGNIIVNATHKSWQKIDEELGSTDLDYTFFSITVFENNQTKKKMLLLQPPSSIELVDSFESLTEIMNALKLHSNHKKEFQLAMHFFAALEKGNPENITLDTLTIPQWYNYYYQKSGSPGAQSSEIYWNELFRVAAQNYDVDTEYIIVKNKEYFKELERLLRIFSIGEDHIAPFVTIKWLINNLYYVNWNAYNQLHPQEKNSTCLQNIKLYGASQTVLQYLRENTDIKYLLETAKTIIHYIAKTINFDIRFSQHLNETEKSALKSYLDNIITPILHNEIDPSVVDNFYGDFKVTHNYAKDIIKYRKIVYTAESRFVDNYGSPEKLPLDMNDLSRAQNRLLLKAYLKMGLLSSANLHKEYHYAVYGTEMSRFIYDLVISKTYGLKENTIKNDEEWLYTKIQHPNELKSCLVDKVPGDEIDTVISEVIALRTAYESMRQNCLHDLIVTKPFVFRYYTFSEDAMFILAYFQNHCFWEAQMGSHILHNFKYSSFTYGQKNCDFGPPQCNIKAF